MALVPERAQYSGSERACNDAADGRLHRLLGPVFPVPVHSTRTLQEALLLLQSRMRTRDGTDDDMVSIGR